MFKPIRRAVHFDFHTMPGVKNFGEEFDAKKFAKQMADANVEYINMFARCNVGYSYYQTKIGIPYPGLKTNMFPEVVKECHKLGIGVTAYVNAGLNHELARLHPEWLQMSIDGKTYRFEEGMSFFRTMCYNSGYHDYLLSEIKEILPFDADGYFCDCMELRPCYCANCLRDMLSEGIDINDIDAVMDFSFRVRKKMCDDIRSIVPQDKRLFFNGPKQKHSAGKASHYEIESLWQYGYFEAHAAYARRKYNEVIFMNGRFQQAWGDFGGYKGKCAMENDFYDALSYGCLAMLGDHLHPARLAEEDIYRDLGEIYAQLKKYEPWTDKAKYCSEIAILTDQATLGDVQFGASKMLSELKYGYDILDPEDDFSVYPLLILPDGFRVDESLAGRISEYLANGGKIISAGSAALTPNGERFANPEWDFDFVGMDTTDAPYFRAVKPDDKILNRDYSVYTPGILVKAKDGNTVIADRVSPYFEKKSWDGRHIYRYNPPDGKDGNSAIIINSKKNVAHIAFPIFADYQTLHPSVYREILHSLIKRFYVKNLIKADTLPTYTKVNITGCEEYKLLHVKVTYPEITGYRGTIEAHTELLCGRKISILGEYENVYSLPDKKKMTSEISCGYTIITLPDIVGYKMFLLE